MLTIVVGGFYGDEGKGKIVGCLARKDDADYVIRAGGGPQAGHTVTPEIKVTQVPSGLVNEKSKLLIGRGTVIDPQIVIAEIKKYGVENRIKIDYGCTIIEEKHKEQEKELVARIGSVGTGTGPARVDRVLRKSKLAKDMPELQPYLADVAEIANKAIADDAKILVEGVQGYGLSLLDHQYYPNVTSQDTTASQFCADIGIGPKAVNEVIVVFKAYVSRVGGGPLPDTQWTEEEKDKLSIREYGSVSGRERRFCDFNQKMAVDALIKNTATQAALTCIDRLYPGNARARQVYELTDPARLFLEIQEELLKQKAPKYFKGINLVSTGPNLEDMIDLRHADR